MPERHAGRKDQLPPAIVPFAHFKSGRRNGNGDRPRLRHDGRGWSSQHQRGSAPILASLGCPGQGAVEWFMGLVWLRRGRGGPDRLRCMPPDQRSLGPCRCHPALLDLAPLFTGSANGTLSADSAEMFAVCESQQAVLPQCQSSGQERPSPQHFHPSEQQELPQQSRPFRQMAERQQRR